MVHCPLLITKVTGPEYKVRLMARRKPHIVNLSLHPSATQKMRIPGDIGIPATENLQLYLSQATLPLMRIPRAAPKLPPPGHRSHNMGLTTRPERYRRLHSMKGLGVNMETEVPKCMRSFLSLPHGETAHSP